jgi:hypothetical protein
MGERADEIEDQINKTRNELSENFYELEEKVRSTFDWRTQFEERPMTLLAVAFGGGALASVLVPMGNRRKRYAADTRNGKTKRTQRTYSAMDAVKGALMTVVASRLGGVLGDFVSNYGKELHKVRQSRRDSTLQQDA